MTNQANKKVRLWPKILLASFSALIALLAAELLVRAFNLAPHVRRIRVSYSDENSIYKRSSDPILGYELKANYHNDHPDYNFTCGSTNSHGQHDVERKVEKPAGVRRVILLGDSVVESTESRGLDDLMNRQLEKLYPDGKTEVLNFGVGGYCTLAEVELLKVKGLQFKPDVVIVVFVWNDFDNFNSSIVEALEAPSKRPSWAFQTLFLHSALFRLASVGLKLTPSKLPDDPALWNKNAIGDNNVVEALRRLREMSREHGFQAAVAVWPDFRSDQIIDRGAIPGSNLLIVAGIARTYGIPTFRLSDYFKRDCASIEPPPDVNTYYTVGDSMHPNARGNRVAAEALYELIENLPKTGAAADSPASRPGDQRAIELAKTKGAGEYDFAVAMCLAANSHLHAGSLDQAILHYEQALEFDPKCYAANASLGNILADRGDFERAEGCLREAVRAVPQSAAAHFYLAHVLASQGKFDEAERCFRESLRLDPESGRCHAVFGEFLLQSGRTEEGRHHLMLSEQIQHRRQGSLQPASGTP